MNIFGNTYYFKCLVKEPTCFKNINNPSCVDLIFTNKSLFFQHTKVIETGLSDFHRLTVTMMKSTSSKKRLIRANNSPFMTKELYEAIMMRSRLRNKFLKFKTAESKNAYKKQRNYCVSVLRSTKQSFYENLDPNLISNNRKFRKHVKPFFSNKTPFSNNITLLEKDDIVTDNTACAEILNIYFVIQLKT